MANSTAEQWSVVRPPQAEAQARVEAQLMAVFLTFGFCVPVSMQSFAAFVVVLAIEAGRWEMPSFST